MNDTIRTIKISDLPASSSINDEDVFIKSNNIETSKITANDIAEYVNKKSDAESNVQSDWAETDTSSDAYIKNKPTALAASGGNADTVNGHSVQSDVPADAEFTDTVYVHPNSGVTAGTYRSVTVNAQGHVTSGSNPTTLSEYGITDAATASHNHTVGNISDLTATAAELNVLDGITASTAELNYTDGVTSNIQTQLDSKINKASVYTKNEVDNKFSSLETNIDWKESVASYDDIADAYPNPADGWTVNVKDTDYTYRYNGTSWVAISANAIPKATDSVDGLLSKEDHAAYDAAKAHADSPHARTDATKTEKSAVNGNIKINGAETVVYTHPGGTNPHGTTKSDVGLGNVPDVATNDQTPTYTEASALTKLSSGEKLSAALGKISRAVTDLISHIGDTVRHITSAERTNWTAAYTHSQAAHAPSGAEVNQNAFSNVAVGTTTIAADSKTDTLTLAAGSNVTLTPDASNDKITISAADTVYTHPAYTARSNGLYKVTVDNTGHVSAASAVTKADITALGIPSSDTNTTYSAMTAATASAAGKAGLVPAPAAGSQSKFLRGDGTWQTPANTTYSAATSSALGLVKSGTDITVDSNGNVSVNDDSHNHVISNVDGLQSALDGKAASNHTHSAYVNQNAFSNITVGSTTVSADSATDTLTLAAGSNVTITPDADNDKITIASKDTVYTHPAYTAKSSGLYKVAVDATGHVSSAAAVTKADITALGIPSSDTNTHYTSKNTVGSSTATSNTTSALTNGNVYLNSVENGAVTSSHKISGSGATTVTADANGNIIISSTDTNTNTDTKVTNTLAKTTKAYVTGTTSATTSTGTQVFDTGVYLDTTAGQLTATTFKGALSGNASTATTATKLGSSTVGSSVKPIYLNAGTATASSSTVGGTAKPVYMNGGTITACSSTVGSENIPVYMKAGTLTACTGIAFLKSLTQAQYNALTDSEKTNGTIYFITDAN